MLIFHLSQTENCWLFLRCIMLSCPHDYGKIVPLAGIPPSPIFISGAVTLNPLKSQLKCCLSHKPRPQSHIVAPLLYFLSSVCVCMGTRVHMHACTALVCVSPVIAPMLHCDSLFIYLFPVLKH